MSEPPDRDNRPREAIADVDHLEDLPDGCGCAEIWEHLSCRRAEAEGD